MLLEFWKAGAWVVSLIEKEELGLGL